MVDVSTQFRLVGRSYLLFVLVPDFPLADWLAGLDAWQSRSPEFFASRPVLLDLSQLSPSRAQVSALVDELKARGIRVAAFEGIESDLIDPALPPLIQANHTEMPLGSSEDMAVPDPALQPASLLLDKPVRSGQSVVFENGDVTVLGSISSGAEVIAGGSIHVYGTLRGRALAGMSGNTQARIFCAKFDAELVAIDGLYASANETMAQLAGRPVQAWREQDSLQMREIISSARRRV